MNMVKIGVFAGFVILGLVPGRAGNEPVTDSLLKALSATIDDSLRVVYNNELAWEFRKTDTTRAIFHASEARAIARRSRFPQGEAESWVRLSNIYEFHGRLAEAREALLQALPIETAVQNNNGIARAQHQLGLIAKKLGDFVEARRYFEASIAYWEKSDGQQKNLAIAYTNLGTVLKYLSDFQGALKSFHHALDIRQSLADQKGTANCYLSLGALYLRLNNGEKAYDYGRQALELFTRLGDHSGVAKAYNNIGQYYFDAGQYDNALEAFRQSLELKSEEGDPYTLSITLANIGALYAVLGKYTPALQNYQQSLELRQKMGDKKGIAESLFQLGNVYHKQGLHNQAIAGYEQSLALAQSSGAALLRVDVLLELSRCLSDIGRFDQATRYSFELFELKDSLDQTYQDAINYKLKYEEERQKLELLQKEQEISEAQLRISEARLRVRNTYLQGVAGVLLLGGTLLLLLFFNNRQKQRLELARKNEHLTKQRVETLLRDQELNFTHARIEGQEMERHRIARDLHDRLGGMLSTVKLYFKAMDNAFPQLRQNGESVHFEKANSLLDEACEEVRKIAHDMEADGLQQYGLIRQLEHFAADMEATNLLRVNFLSHGFDRRLPINQESRLYTIIRELVSNVLNHARATELTIQLNQLGETINIMVEDDGIGFDPDAIGRRHGMGLRSIRDRVAAMGGAMLIDSGRGAGTTITLDIPRS